MVNKCILCLQIKLIGCSLSKNTVTTQNGACVLIYGDAYLRSTGPEEWGRKKEGKKNTSAFIIR